MEQRHGVTLYRRYKCDNFFVILVRHIAYTMRRRRHVHSARRCMPYGVRKYHIFFLTVQHEKLHTAVTRLRLTVGAGKRRSTAHVPPSVVYPFAKHSLISQHFSVSFTPYSTA
jgi:hypothetical protein